MKTSNSNSVFANITFVKDSSSGPTFKPNVEKLINTPEAVFTIELYAGWFRIIRLLNQRRTHEFIINNFRNNQILVENSNSMHCTIQLTSDNDIIEMFKDAKIYTEYKRPKDAQYVHVESTLSPISDIIKEWHKYCSI